jgi:hypothetical protein
VTLSLSPGLRDISINSIASRCPPLLGQINGGFAVEIMPEGSAPWASQSGIAAMFQQQFHLLFLAIVGSIRECGCAVIVSSVCVGTASSRILPT